MNIDFSRQQMVDQQVRAWEVYDPSVLQVLVDVPREQFVPAAFESMAFADIEIPIGHGEYMMTPTIEGRVLQALELQGTEHVLEVGTGTGFLTACLARLTNKVTSIDIHDDFIKMAGRNLENTGVDNAELLVMDAIEQLPEGRYDAIAMTGSIQTFDPRFVQALSPSGRLFVVVGDPPVMDARVVERTGKTDWQSESLFETNLQPLVHASLPAPFAF